MANISPVVQTIQPGKFARVSGNGAWFFLQECSGAAKVRINGGIALPFKRAMTYHAEPGQIVRDVEIHNVDAAAISVVGYIGRGELTDNGVDVSGSVSVNNFPAVQPVEINGGAGLDVAPVNKMGSTIVRWKNANQIPFVPFASNVNGVIIRTMHISVAPGNGIAVHSMPDGSTPNVWDNNTSRILHNYNDDYSNFDGLPLPLEFAGGQGLWIYGSAASTGVISYDVLGA